MVLKTTNECTHFSCIMDPTYGTIRWLEVVKFEESGSEEEHDDPELLETVVVSEGNPDAEASEFSSISEKGV